MLSSGASQRIRVQSSVLVLLILEGAGTHLRASYPVEQNHGRAVAARAVSTARRPDCVTKPEVNLFAWTPIEKGGYGRCLSW